MERRYENEVVGFNTRMTDIHAAIGRVQLDASSPAGPSSARRTPPSSTPTSTASSSRRSPTGATHVYHQYTIRVAEDRDGFAARAARGARRRLRGLLPDPEPPAPVVRRSTLDLPETERAAAEVLSLPVHPSLTQDDLERIVAAVNAARPGPMAPRMAATLRAGLIGLGHDGPPPRPGARVARRASSSSPSPTPSATRTAWPGGRPLPAPRRGPGRRPASTTAWSPSRRPTTSGSALALADAGVHALVEKPLAPDGRRREPARRRRSSPRAWSGPSATSSATTPRCSSLRVAARSTASSGSVYQIVTRRQGPFPARIADVGVVKDLATHDIDLTAWVPQQPYRRWRRRTAYKSGREYEDLVAVVGSLADGTVTNHLVNWLSPMKERVTIVTGEQGRVRRRHPHRRPDLLRQRHRAHTSGTPSPSSAASPRATSSATPSPSPSRCGPSTSSSATPCSARRPTS